MSIKRYCLSAALFEGCGVVDPTCSFAGGQRHSPMQGTAPMCNHPTTTLETVQVCHAVIDGETHAHVDRYVQSHCDLCMPAQRGKPCRRTLKLGARTVCCTATSDTHRGLRWCSTLVAISVQLLPSSYPKSQKLSEAGALLGLWRGSTSYYSVFFVSSCFLFLCFFFLSVTSSSFLLISLPRRCSITNDSLGDGVFFYIYFTHRSVQSHRDLDMPAQRRNPGRRTRMLRSIAVVRWTALELEVERTFEARTVRFLCHSGQE